MFLDQQPVQSGTTTHKAREVQITTSELIGKLVAAETAIASVATSISHAVNQLQQPQPNKCQHAASEHSKQGAK